MPSIKGRLEKVARKKLETKFGQTEKFGFLIEGIWYSALGHIEYWSQFHSGSEFPEHEWIQKGEFKNLIFPLRPQTKSGPLSSVVQQVSLGLQPPNLDLKLSEINKTLMLLLGHIEKVEDQLEIVITSLPKKQFVVEDDEIPF